MRAVVENNFGYWGWQPNLHVLDAINTVTADNPSSCGVEPLMGNTSNIMRQIIENPSTLQRTKAYPGTFTSVGKL